MEVQQQIANLKIELAAIDSAIAESEAALQSASTPGAEIRSRRAALVDLNAQRSELTTNLINLQASTTTVEAMRLSPQAQGAKKRARKAGG